MLSRFHIIIFLVKLFVVRSIAFREKHYVGSIMFYKHKSQHFIVALIHKLLVLTIIVSSKIK